MRAMPALPVLKVAVPAKLAAAAKQVEACGGESEPQAAVAAAGAAEKQNLAQREMAAQAPMQVSEGSERWGV
eukprot:3611637-Pleurochrysis_carterae.AAC.1